MYGKIFHSIYDGTLAEDWRALITFQQLIVLCDADGIVDMTPASISRRTGIPLEHIEHGLSVLEKEDEHSRTPNEKGRRIELIDDHRPWGWHIVNHKHYRDLRTSEDRREYMRNYMKEKRSKQKLTKANDSKQLTKLANKDTDTKTDKDTNTDSNTKTTDQNTMPSKLDDVVESQVILDYLNDISGKLFKHVDSNLRLIKARLKEGHSEKDIYAVIDKKVTEWENDPKMAKYIRPATLFNAEKFNQYVGELGVETPDEKRERELSEWANTIEGELQ